MEAKIGILTKAGEVSITLSEAEIQSENVVCDLFQKCLDIQNKCAQLICDKEELYRDERGNSRSFAMFRQVSKSRG